jgi:ribosomal protein L37AE/L43A
MRQAAYECPFCNKPLANERAACCGEVGHAQEVDEFRCDECDEDISAHRATEGGLCARCEWLVQS